MDNDTLIEEMHAYVGLAYSLFMEKHRAHRADPVKQLSEETGMARSTVRNLIAKTTKFPRYLTLKKFGNACGLYLVWTKSGQPRLKLAS